MSKFTWADPPGDSAFPIAKPGYKFIYASAFTTAIMALLGYEVLTLFFFAATVFICCFFRDPDRLVSKEEDAIASPADGKIVFADIVESNRFIEGPCLKISIFMSVFNVHVNRIPFSGTVKRIEYHPGKFFQANLDKASEENEHNAIIADCNGSEICFVQIAGLVARRILCGLQPGDEVNKGERFGMICFGSRVDIYLPPEAQALVKVGDRVFGGSSVIGRMP